MEFPELLKTGMFISFMCMMYIWRSKYAKGIASAHYRAKGDHNPINYTEIKL